MFLARAAGISSSEKPPHLAQVVNNVMAALAHRRRAVRGAPPEVERNDTCRFSLFASEDVASVC